MVNIAFQYRSNNMLKTTLIKPRIIFVNTCLAITMTLYHKQSALNPRQPVHVQESTP